jgi:hypothetical protein
MQAADLTVTINKLLKEAHLGGQIYALEWALGPRAELIASSACNFEQVPRGARGLERGRWARGCRHF